MYLHCGQGSALDRANSYYKLPKMTWQTQASPRSTDSTGQQMPSGTDGPSVQPAAVTTDEMPKWSPRVSASFPARCLDTASCCISPHPQSRPAPAAPAVAGHTSPVRIRSLQLLAHTPDSDTDTEPVLS